MILNYVMQQDTPLAVARQFLVARSNNPSIGGPERASIVLVSNFHDIDGVEVKNEAESSGRKP
jgi:hypothetical protein